MNNNIQVKNSSTKNFGMVKLKNPLRIYLKEAQSRNKCPKAWEPQIYEFTKSDLSYNANAFDKISPLTTLVDDDYSLFTEYLYSKNQKNTNYFYKWIIDSSKRTYSEGQKDIEICDKKWEFFESWYPKRSRLRSPIMMRSLSLSHLSNDVLISMTDKIKKPRFIPLNVLQRTRFGSQMITKLYFEKIMKAEKFIWYNLSKMTLKTGWLPCTLEQNTLYGPQRFYIRLLTEITNPGVSFTSNYKRYCKKFGTQPVHMIDLKEGPAIYIDISRHDITYYPVYVLCTRSELTPIYCLETGEINEIPKNVALTTLFYLPFQMRTYIKPLRVPCRMENSYLYPHEWKNFIDMTKKMKKLYITRVYNNCCVVGRVHPDPIRSIYNAFCDDIYCTGDCAADDYLEEIYRKRSKSEIEKNFGN